MNNLDARSINFVIMSYIKAKLMDFEYTSFKTLNISSI